MSECVYQGQITSSLCAYIFILEKERFEKERNERFEKERFEKESSLPHTHTSARTHKHTSAHMREHTHTNNCFPIARYIPYEAFNEAKFIYKN